MGDVAMMVPVVASLARQYPQLRITVMSRPFARSMFEGLSPNIGFMEADVRKDYRGLHGLNVLYRRLVSKKFTAVADCHDVLRTKYLRLRFLLGGFKVAHINKHRCGKRRLTRRKNKIFVQQPTSFDNYMEVLAQLGYPVDAHFTSIYPPEGAPIDTLYNIIGRKEEDQKWIGVAPFAAHKGKIYPLDKMEEALQLIVKQFSDSRIFLFGGGKEEQRQLEDMSSRVPKSLSVAGKLGGLENEMRLMSHLDVMISMDSANMHLASLTSTPVVSVWGATHPYAGFMGWNQLSDDAVQVDLPCRPCSIYGNKPCFRGDYACLSMITPSMIASHVASVLERKAK